MRIAVLGGGHGCYAAAADLSDAGHELRLWRRDAAALALPELEMRDEIERTSDSASLIAPSSSACWLRIAASRWPKAEIAALSVELVSPLWVVPSGWACIVT